MTIKIGGRTLSTRRPKDLDAALEASTGCNAVEIARILAGYPNAGQVAAALQPFLPDDAPSGTDLASEIASGDLAVTVTDVRKLYAVEAAAVAAGQKAE
jgi:hypothetical protein